MDKLNIKYEAWSAGILLVIVTILLPAFNVCSIIVWLSSIFVGISSLVLIGIKMYLFNQKIDIENSITKQMNEFSEMTKYAMFNKISTMQSSQFMYAKKVLSEASKQIEKIIEGIIYMSEAEYFDEIISESEKISNSEVLAVNAFDERRFVYDPREIKYFEENKKGINERNVRIKRIFIYDDKQSNTDIQTKRIKAIKMNYEAKINIFVVYKSKLIGLKNSNELCQDAVLFCIDYPKLYIDYQDKIDETRVSYGELRINNSDIEQFKSNFNTLKNMAISEQEMLELWT